MGRTRRRSPRRFPRVAHAGIWRCAGGGCTAAADDGGIAGAAEGAWVHRVAANIRPGITHSSRPLAVEGLRTRVASTSITVAKTKNTMLLMPRAPRFFRGRSLAHAADTDALTEKIWPDVAAWGCRRSWRNSTRSSSFRSTTMIEMLLLPEGPVFIGPLNSGSSSLSTDRLIAPCGRNKWERQVEIHTPPSSSAAEHPLLLHHRPNPARTIPGVAVLRASHQI